MQIDPPPPLPHGAAPSENFVGVADNLHVYVGGLYPLLTQGLRDADEAGTLLLKRLLQRPEELIGILQQKIWKLPYLIDYRKTPDYILDALRWIVGFGPGSGGAGKLAESLTFDELRSLIKIATQFWRKRGRRDLLVDSIRFFATGVSPQVDDYFYMQAIFDEVLWGFEEGAATDLWMIYTPETAPSPGVDAGNFVVIRVPDQGSLNRSLVEQLAELQRGVGERYEIAYVDFLDTFADGRLGQWINVGAQTPLVAADSSTDPAQLPGFLFSATERERADAPLSASWTKYFWRSIIYWQADCVLRLRYYVSGDDDCYYFEIDSAASTVELFRLVAGTPTSLASAGAIDLAVPAPRAVWVETTFDGVGPNFHRLHIDGDIVLTHSGDTTHRAGTVEVEHVSGGAFVFARTEVFEDPLDTVLIEP